MSSTSKNIKEMMYNIGKKAKEASSVLARASTKQKNDALASIAEILEQSQQNVLSANKKDMKEGQDNDLDTALLDRLELTASRCESMLQGLKDVQKLADPIGEMTDFTYRPSGIQLGKMRVPLGVVGMIYESRPNVTVEAAALAIKSGNAIILRGGKEAFHSNQAIAQCIQAGLKKSGLPSHCVQVVETTDRAAVGELITMTDFVDVIIPRGGRGLIERISQDARIPVIKHLDGNCHTYVHAQADFDKAIPIIINAKTQRYGTCNTMETLLVDCSIAQKFLPIVADALIHADSAMQLRGCEKTQSILGDKVIAATQEDWDTEYLAPILAIKVVSSVDEAIKHINTHGSHHTDVILTEDYSVSRTFIQNVDSASVMINASSRFADGFEYGLGAEIGISTDKIHARGPVGLHGLTSQKWIVFGDGNIRE